MRSEACKVDLEEIHKFCPLCGKKAVVSKQQIVLLTVPYSGAKGRKTKINRIGGLPVEHSYIYGF